VGVLTERRGSRATWGDAEARRRDILEAATTILDREGYTALTMRAIAQGAAVSPGTIYHHFVDKQHVVAALMEQRLAALRITVATASRADGVRGILRAAVPDATDTWRYIGRTAVGWAHEILGPDLDIGRTPPAADKAWRSMLDALHEAMSEAAAYERSRLRESRALIPFVWAGLMGLADDLVNGWSASAGLPEQDFVDFSVDALARAVTKPIERVHEHE
jgi:AcrR family transcriptional regulator